MLLHQARDLLAFPAGDNGTDALINGQHYNVTTLDAWNFTYYSNGTLSNGSSCWLVFDAYRPLLLPNGTFVNGTTCYFPFYAVGSRGMLGIAFASLFAVTVALTILNLGKHGRLYLPQEKRFHAIGRRWQWYWMFFVAGCGMISCISAIDVDRDYLQATAIVLENFFFYLMMPGVLATVWEGVRHWGSWQERQIYDRDPFSLPQEGPRERKEFYLPLIFYLFAWLNFFMNIPRSWTGVERQSSPAMVQDIAKPWSTDLRFKAGAILAVLAWLIIVIHLHHSIQYYRPRAGSPWRRALLFVRSIPPQFALTLPLLLLVIGYAVASSFSFAINIAFLQVDTGYMYGLGYAPVLAILFVNEIAGMLRPNEDRALIRQRIERGQAADAEIGILGTRKPAWWRPFEGFKSTEARLKALTTEVGGGRPTGRSISENLELRAMSPRARGVEEAERPPRYEERAGDDPFSDPFSDVVDGEDDDERPEGNGRYAGSGAEEHGREVRREESSNSIGGKPQVVQSMLDI